MALGRLEVGKKMSPENVVANGMCTACVPLSEPVRRSGAPRAPDAMGMPPPPPRFDGTVANADDGGKQAMPPPPPLFSAQKTEGAEKHEGDLAPPARAEPPADASRAPAGGYEVPEWGGPSSADFSLEVLKDGTIVDVVDCRGRCCVTLGRTPDNDVVLEHPSSSRTHAVIQFARGRAEAFAFDNASTHGTFVNKRRLKARVHAPVFVGDQIRFGQSSRVFVVSGASELMPEEGLSRDERRRLRALEKMSEAERNPGSSGLREASSDGKHGRVDWGMGDMDDRPSETETAALAALDWRDHAGALTEKQEKLKEKIRRKEEKVRALRTESERISAKERESAPLTQGQRMTLARNESAVEKLEEEIEDADEALNESIRASLGGAAAKSARSTKKKKARRDVAGSDSDDAYGSDSDDTFYDRTASATARRLREKERRLERRRGSKASEDAPVAVETAATLWEKKRVAAAALEASRTTLADLKAKAACSDGEAPPTSRDVASNDTKTVTETVTETERADDLDAFMVSVARARDEEALADAARRVAEKETELARLDRLLRLADPRGEFAPGSDMQRSVERLAEAARARVAAEEQSARRRAAAKAEAQVAHAAAEAERARLAEWEKRGELVAKRAFAGSGGPGATRAGVTGAGVANALAPVDQASAAANAALPVGLSTGEARNTSGAAPSGSAAAPIPASGPAAARRVPIAPDDDGFLAPEQLRAAHLERGGPAGLEIRAPKRRKGDDAARGAAAAAAEAAEARVADDVRRLMGCGGGFDAGDGDGDGDGDGADAAVFTVPQGQSGDGRTRLNDKLGY